MVAMRSSSYKNKVLFCAATLLAFVAINYAIWQTLTRDLLTDIHYDGGDLARMSYLADAKLPRRNKATLPNRHIPFKEYQGGPVDMVTIGDSFSNGGAGGENRYYQDYIASLNKMTVLNLDHYRDLDLITTVCVLANNGFLDRVRPRYLLIEASEKGVKELIRGVDFARTASMEEVRAFKLFPQAAPPKVPFINNGNFKYLLNRVAYRFSDHGFYGGVYLAKLERDFFSIAKGNRLLYLRNPANFTAAEVSQLNDNLNRLADLLAGKGIKMVYMPYVDKYTLYSKWLPKKRFPESQFFELLRPLAKRYRLIDTKAILGEMLERGEKDVFYPDDTHASWKASERIFSQERFDPPTSSLRQLNRSRR